MEPDELSGSPVGFYRFHESLFYGVFSSLINITVQHFYLRTR